MGESGGESGDLESLRTEASNKADSMVARSIPRAFKVATVRLSLALALNGVSGSCR